MVEKLDQGTLKLVRDDVYKILHNDMSGHGWDHVKRVYDMAMRFCADLPRADCSIVQLAALLHDVDDYKLVGRVHAANLTNATRIMAQHGISAGIQAKVSEILSTMGYSKSLRGVRPKSIEGKIVSDADMCDGIGATGIVRALVYAVSSKGNGIVFDKDILPNIEIKAHEYNAHGSTHDTDSFVNHFFEKLLKIPTMMMTEPGRREASERNRIMVDFLRQFFIEYNVPEWNKLLDDYLAHPN